MTTPNTNNRWQYDGDGSTTAFAVDNLIFSHADLIVNLLDEITGATTLQVLNTDYTITPAASLLPAVATVTFTTAPTTDQKVIIVRRTAINQTATYNMLGQFPSTTHEDTLDKGFVGVQQVEFDIERSIRLGDDDELATLSKLPPKASRAGGLLGFTDPGGDVMISGGGSGDVAVSVAMTPVVQASTLAAARTAMDVQQQDDGLDALAGLGSTVGPVRQTAADTFAVLQDNLAATTAPGTGNDNTEGYAVGSLWIDVTADVAHVCLDASTGAAVWHRLSANGIVSQAEAQAGTATTPRYFTAQRVKQAIDALGGSGGLIPVSTYAVAAASAQDVEDTELFDGTYDAIVIDLIQAQVATDGVDFALTVGTGAGPTYQANAGDYEWAREATATTGAQADTNNGNTFIDLSFHTTNGLDGLSNVDGEDLYMRVVLFRPDSTAGKKHFWTYGSVESERNTLQTMIGSAWYVGGSAAVTGLRFAVGSGNYDATINTYGVKIPT